MSNKESSTIPSIITFKNITTFSDLHKINHCYVEFTPDTIKKLFESNNITVEYISEPSKNISEPRDLMDERTRE
jgi:hypothetical protein